MSLAAAGGRRAWSRTTSSVSEHVIHLVPLRVGEERVEKMLGGRVDSLHPARGAMGEGRGGGIEERFGDSRHGGGLMRPDGRRDT